MNTISTLCNSVSALALVVSISLAGSAQAQQSSGNTGCYSGSSYDAARNSCGEGGAPSGAVGPSAVPGQAKVITGAGCYSGSGEQAASNACGEGGAPAGPVGPSAVAPSSNVITGSGCYSGTADQAASNACGEGGAPRGPVGPSATH